jgi:hypothetical protein
MSSFAIDMGEQNSYTSEAPKGVDLLYSSLKNSNWQLAVDNQPGKPNTAQSYAD